MPEILNDWLTEQATEIALDHSLGSLLDEFAAELTGTDVRDIEREFNNPEYVRLRNKLEEKLTAAIFAKVLKNEANTTPLLTRILDQLAESWVHQERQSDARKR